MTISMDTLDDVTSFDPNRLNQAWYDFTPWSDAVGWSLQAIVTTVAAVREEVGDGAVGWVEFEERMTSAAFVGNDAWRYHPILQRVLKTARDHVPHGPLGLSNEQWLQIGDEAEGYVAYWGTDSSDLKLLAEELRIDHSLWIPAQAAAEATEVVYEPDRDFARLMQHYVGTGGTLPDPKVVSSWFPGGMRPEAIVTRCVAAFPQGLSGNDTYSLAYIGAFYLGAETWARTSSWYVQEQPARQSKRPMLSLDKDFVSFVKRQLRSTDALPALAAFEERFAPRPWPEAVVARFQAEFPQGVSSASRKYSLGQIGAYYLGAKEWGATVALQNEELGPEFVQTILGYFEDESELTPEQIAQVDKAIAAGLITVEDDD